MSDIGSWVDQGRSILKKRVAHLTDGAPPEELAELLLAGATVLAAGFVAFKRNDRATLRLALVAAKAATNAKRSSQVITVTGDGG